MGFFSKVGKELKSDIKQGMGDAIDTVTSIPSRVASAMGNKSSDGRASVKNSGEQAAVELASRAKAAMSAGKKAFVNKKGSLKAEKKVAKKN